MIVPRYEIANSAIAGAGKGVFLLEPVPRGAVIVAPDRIDQTVSKSELEQYPHGTPHADASVRWFEDHHTICLDWSDECYINHSFRSTGLWHLGFVFARHDLDVGTEVTMDYRFILGDGLDAGFRDAETGEVVSGFSWAYTLRQTTQELHALLASI